MKTASVPLELVVQVLMVGAVVGERIMEWVEEVAMEALGGEAMVEEVNWCRRHSHSQDTTS